MHPEVKCYESCRGLNTLLEIDKVIIDRSILYNLIKYNESVQGKRIVGLLYTYYTRY
jgi:hypothetical protein